MNRITCECCLKMKNFFGFVRAENLSGLIFFLTNRNVKHCIGRYFIDIDILQIILSRPCLMSFNSWLHAIGTSPYCLRYGYDTRNIHALWTIRKHFFLYNKNCYRNYKNHLYKHKWFTTSKIFFFKFKWIGVAVYTTARANRCLIVRCRWNKKRLILSKSKFNFAL